MTGTSDFEGIVDQHYVPLYRFALSLTRQETDACDLTQQTFYIWAAKGHQLQDRSKVKVWLFTTLYREFLELRRRGSRFTHEPLDEAASEIPSFHPDLANQLDAGTAAEWLGQLDPLFQGPVALFYLQDCSYKEIAEILAVPLGTVKSRIARGLSQLQKIVLLHQDQAERQKRADHLEASAQHRKGAP